MTRGVLGRLALGVAACAVVAGVSACDSSGSTDSPVPTTTFAVPSVSASPGQVASASTGPDTGPATDRTASAPPSRLSSAHSSSSAVISDPAVTRQIVVRPVTSSGQLAPGWSARAQDLTVACSGALRSPVARSNDVLYCSPSAASAIACWHAAAPAYAYCLPDPRSHTVNRFRLQNSAFPAPHPTEFPPAPAALDLIDGTRCSVRIGGAAARLGVHPDWVPYYFCGSGEDTAIWAPPNAPNGGVLRGDGVWTVQASATDGSKSLRTVGVDTAYFVGTA